MKKIYILLCLALFTTQMSAQEKTLTFQDLIPGGKNNHRFVPRNIRQLQWCGDYYTYVKGDSLLMAKPQEKSEHIALTIAQLNEALTAAGMPKTSFMPAFFVPDERLPIIAFHYKNNRVHYDLTTKKIVANYPLDKKGSRWEYDKANGLIAFTKENNILILSPDSTTEQVTHETDKGIVCGTPVHQHEFGIRKGLFWSPDGKALAFYRMDETMIPDYPIVNVNPHMAKTEPFKYPMAGMKSHEVTVGVYHLSDKKTVRLKTGLPKEKYLTNIAWSPNGKSIYIAELNRGQDTCRLVRYDASTGNREKELFVETNTRYVEPQKPPLFVPGHPELFVWESQRDGFNHLYLYNTDGKLIRQLTSGRWQVLQTLGFDAQGEHLYFTATAPHNVNSTEEGSPLEIYAWRLNIKSGKRTCLNKKTGVHHVSPDATYTYMIDYTTSPAIPRDIDLVRIKDGRTLKTMLSAKDPFADYDMPTIHIGTLTAADGKTKLYYRLVTPPAMDTAKKHPAIIYVYGGPHAQLISGGWMNGTGGWDLYMARKGYVMLTIDSRGSANRGFEFESVIHRNLGQAEMADQMKGVELLRSLPYVDGERLGVHGWSYGGFMTTNLMLTHPDVFKVGVAGGPVIDWNRYEIMYGERYMDHPKENPDGYENANLLLKAGNLKGHLLLIHGTADPVVVWQHSLLFLQECINAGTFPDYFVYPGHPHNVIGKDRPHLYEKVTKYFDDYL